MHIVENMVAKSTVRQHYSTFGVKLC
nr:unnamed protein product [Callosobruchus analis]